MLLVIFSHLYVILLPDKHSQSAKNGSECIWKWSILASNSQVCIFFFFFIIFQTRWRQKLQWNPATTICLHNHEAGGSLLKLTKQNRASLSPGGGGGWGVLKRQEQKWLISDREWTNTVFLFSSAIKWLGKKDYLNYFLIFTNVLNVVQITAGKWLHKCPV